MQVRRPTVCALLAGLVALRDVSAADKEWLKKQAPRLKAADEVQARDMNSPLAGMVCVIMHHAY